MWKGPFLALNARKGPFPASEQCQRGGADQAGVVAFGADDPKAAQEGQAGVHGQGAPDRVEQQVVGAGDAAADDGEVQVADGGGGGDGQAHGLAAAFEGGGGDGVARAGGAFQLDGVGAVALIANLVVAVVVTLIARQAKWFNGLDATNRVDYEADDGDPKLKEIAVH